MSIAEFSVKNKVFVNLLMVIIIIAGIFSVLSLPQEDIPPIDFHWAFIQVVYPGASPRDVEEIVIKPLEEKIKGYDKIDEVISKSSEGFGFIIVKFLEMSDLEFKGKLQDIRGDIDKLDLEDEIDVNVDEISTSYFLPIMNIGILYSTDEKKAIDIAEELKDRLEQIPDIVNIKVSGIGDKQIRVVLNLQKLLQSHISLSQIINTIRTNNVFLPLGEIELNKEKLTMVIRGKLKKEQLDNLVVAVNKDGHKVMLKDIATIEYTRKQADILSKINGKNMILISFSKKAKGKTLKIVKEVKDLLEDYSNSLPPYIQLKILYDASVNIKRNINLLVKNAIIGLFVVFWVVLIFIGFYNAILASVGIPISFLITFIFMHITGQTINSSSLFGLIMVLGIIVDDAIIILENVFSKREKENLNLEEATIKGTEEVTSAVVSGVLTTVAAFIPLMFLPGTFGKFLKVIPIVVSISLLGSLFEALFILPSHIVDWTPKKYNFKEKIKFTKFQQLYEKALVYVLERRYRFLLIIFIMFLSVIPIIRYIGIDLFKGDPYPYFRVLIKLPEGTSIEKTEKVLSNISKYVYKRIGEDNIDYIEEDAGLFQSKGEWLVQDNVGQLYIHLKEEKAKYIKRYIKRLQRLDRDFPILTYVDIKLQEMGPPAEEPIAIRIQSDNLDTLIKVKEVVKDYLRKDEYLYNIKDNLPLNAKTLVFKVDHYKANILNINPSLFIGELRALFYENKVTSIKENGEDIDIILTTNYKNFIKNIEDLKNTMIINQQGKKIPLRNFCNIYLKRDVSTIRHYNGKRTVYVYSDYKKEKITLDKINLKIKKEIFPKIKERFSNVNLSLGGQFKELQKSMKNLAKLFFIAILIIYLILASQFKSYVQPVIILFTVPFAIIGAIYTLFIMGEPFNLSSAYGIVALAGIAVNDAIVLISVVNMLREKGMSAFDSVVEGAKSRLRPIILTTVTTVFGLLPTVIGLGGKSLTWQPLAATIAFGLLFSSFLTLFIIPAVILVNDKIRGIK